MKQFLKKFKDFKLTAYIEAITGAVAVIAALLIMILYQTNQTRLNPDGSPILIPGFPGEPIMGMIFFLAGLLAIIMSIVAVYSSLPFIFKKDEKLTPNKAIPFFGAVAGGFALIEIIFTFLMAFKEGSRHTVGLIIFAIVLLLAAAVQLLMLYPALTVRVKKD